MKLEKILIIPDTHVPYQDKKAFELMLKVGKDFKPDHVVILGDFVDFYSVSNYSKDPNRVSLLEEEVEATKEALGRVKALKAKNNVFIAGNHEDRLERYLKDKAPELFNYVTIPKVLELKENGFKYVPYKHSYKLGKLYFTHDVGNAGRFAHYKALDTFQHNIITGHTHRLGYAIEGNAEGERHVTAMLGWLGDVSAIDYMHIVKAKKDWSLGFGVAYMEPNGNAHVVPVPIVDNKCVVEGKLYSV